MSAAVGGGVRGPLRQDRYSLAAVLGPLFQVGDPGRDAPPEGGGGVVSFEVRHLSLNATVEVSDLRAELMEAVDRGSGGWLHLGVG